MTIAPPLTNSPRDRVTLALHRSRRAYRSRTISRDILHHVRKMADAFLDECREAGIVVLVDGEPVE